MAAGSARRWFRQALALGAERLLYQTRARTDDLRPYVPPRLSWPRAAAELNRRLFERGIAPPWVLSAAGCERYWASRSAADAENGPGRYASKPLDIIEFLDGFWSPEVSPRDSVLELGCSSGANLEGLRRLGFSRLAGFEINPEAPQVMQRAFPELARQARVTVGSADEVLPRLASGSQDVVLTVATLIHVHPTSHQVMAEVIRVARRYVCVVETEWITCSYVFARDYRRVFERLGARQVRTQTIAVNRGDDGLADYVGYTARLFEVPDA